MSDDPNKHLVVAGLQYASALEHAKTLLRLADASPAPDETRALAGGAIVIAIGSLAQGLEHRLISAFAQAAAAEGIEPLLADVRRQIRAGVSAQLKQLPTVLGDPCLRLHERLPDVVRLLRAISLRNRLIHNSGEFLIGRLSKFDYGIENGRLVLRFPKPKEPWADVNIGLARFVVETCEAYFADLDEMLENPTTLVSKFFCRIPHRR